MFRSALSLFLAFFVSLLVRPADAHAPAGTLTVSNDRAEVVAVLLDRDTLGDVSPRASRNFTVGAGHHEVLVRARDGRVLERTLVHVASGVVTRVRVDADPARLELDNHTGIALAVRMDPGSSFELAAGEHRTFEVAAGSTQVVATYVQLGAERTLVNRILFLEPGASETVAFDAPGFGLVRVTNRVGHEGTLLIDGRHETVLDDGATREFIVPLGRVRLGLQVNGRRVDSTTLTATPFADLTWTARREMKGTLLADSHDEHTTRVWVDGTLRATVEPFGEDRIELSCGSHRVLVKDNHGRVVADTWIAVTRNEVETVHFGSPPPRAHHERPRASWSVRVGL